MIWRALQGSDVPAACELNRLAGWNQTAADWRGYLAFEPEGCFAVEIDGALAGTATTLRYDGTVGWIGMVLVHPDHRRKGLGTDLLRKAIAYLQGRGVNSIKLDATPMGRKVYVPLGFKDESEVSRWEGVSPAEPAPSPLEHTAGSAEAARAPLAPSVSPMPPGRDEAVKPEAQRVAVFQPAVLAVIADLDRIAFGTGRRQVLAALSGRNPELCFVAPDAGGTPPGYLIARAGREAVQVGPWVARDATVAAHLWEAFCRAAPGRRVLLDLPAGNLAGRTLLESSGFRIQRSFTRMYLGDPGPPGNPALVFGTSGAEKG